MFFLTKYFYLLKDDVIIITALIRKSRSQRLKLPNDLLFFYKAFHFVFSKSSASSFISFAVIAVPEAINTL